MPKIAVIGAGKIGGSIAKLLNQDPKFELKVIDSEQAPLDMLFQHNIPCTRLDINQSELLEENLADCEAVISACSYHASERIATAALNTGCSYFDLTEDVAATEAIKKISEKANPGQVFVPQCGLAPGFIGILANHLSKQFDTVDSLQMRVGALPEFPTNTMMYNITWSTDGLINEYCNPCNAIKNGRLVEVAPLEGLESFSLDGAEYEAFNTSGGLGTLCETLSGKVNDLTYKTVRYKGHQYLMDFLINGLKLGGQRELLRDIFENAIAATKQDVIVILVSATGYRNGQLHQITDSRKIYHRNLKCEKTGIEEHWSGIQITTAGSLCAVVDLFFDKVLPQKGFVGQEDIPFDKFMATRCGNFYKGGSLES